jgi:hypothetical protein
VNNNKIIPFSRRLGALFFAVTDDANSMAREIF